MRRRISLITLVVRDYDEAVAFYVGTLGFVLREDTVLSAEKRWVVVAPSSEPGTGILLARAATNAQVHAIGNQTGGRVSLFLETDDIRRDYKALTEKGVRFTDPPRTESYGMVAVFEDLYGNRWDLIEPASATA